MTDLEKLARSFHEAYETLAPSFGYVTRAETREFDPNSANGMLMMAVCEVVLGEEGRRIRAAGRIQGLEEAVSLVLGACPRCKGRGLDPSTSGIYGCTACFEPRQAIRARIQELEDKK